MELIRIKETCLYVKNLNDIKRFYHEVLELPIISYVENKHVFFRAGDSVLLCFNPEDSKLKQSPPAHYGGGNQHFAFEVLPENYEKTKAEIISRGLDIIDEVTWTSGSRSFYFKDPEGNILEVLPSKGIWD